MATNYDIETLVEDAIVSVLNEDGLNVERWEDLENVNLTPMTKVRVELAEEEFGTVNTYSAIRCLVDITCFTAKKRDVKGRVSNENRGQVRKTFSGNDIADRLSNTSTYLSVYECGVYPQGSFDASNDKLYGKGLTFMVVCLPIN